MPVLPPAFKLHPCLSKQHGAVLMVMLVILIVGASAMLLNTLSNTALRTERDKKTADALLQAKEALIGFSASVDLTSSRPGDLPCPDTDNDGISGGFSIFSCNLQTQQIGRLPWKTLGLPDLRDSSGERLWYAVSSNFKNSTRTSCPSPGQPGCLNSDTVGTITIRSGDGNIISNASLGDGVAAVIIAPGSVLQRTDQGTPQDRSNSGINTPSNYLDIVTSIEDNADFTDSATNGFIQGIVKDSSGRIVLNDQLLVITQDNIMQAIQKRVAGEVKKCLNDYADPATLPAPGIRRYPWAAKLDPSLPASYVEMTTTLFGRIPDTPFSTTVTDSSGYMANTWPGSCKIISSTGWWLNWKDMIFFGIPNTYQPASPTGPVTCSTCLIVNPPSTVADKKFVVFVAGKKLTGQNRSGIPAIGIYATGLLSNYLEGANADGTTPFEQQPKSTVYNDTVVFQ